MMTHNIEAERAVVGEIIGNPAAFSKVCSILSTGDFYDERHGFIWESIVRLSSASIPVDLITLSTDLAKLERLEKVGGKDYLVALQDTAPHTNNIKHHAETVRGASIKRNLTKAGIEISTVGNDPSTGAEESVARAHDIFSKIGTVRGNRLEQIYDAGYEVMDEMARGFENPDEVMGLETGLKALDRALGGLQKQDNIVIAGRPGSGKSALADTIALNVAKKGKRVALFTLEMSKKQRITRWNCMETGYNYDEIARRHRKQNPDGSWRNFTNEEQSDILHKCMSVSVLPIHIEDSSAVKVLEAQAMIGEMALSQPADLIIFDYLGLAGDKAGEKRYEQVGAISRGLKAMAKSANAPLLTLAQLNRECEKRADKKPELADLRDAGDVEQDADIVILLWRAGMYWQDEQEWRKTFPRDPYPGENIAELNIAKFRNGSPGYIELFFDAPRMRFLDIAREY